MLISDWRILGRKVNMILDVAKHNITQRCLKIAFDLSISAFKQNDLLIFTSCLETTTRMCCLIKKGQAKHNGVRVLLCNQYGLLQPFHWWKDKQHISTSLGLLTMLRKIVRFLWGRKKRTTLQWRKKKTNEGLCRDPSTFVSLFRCIYLI